MACFCCDWWWWSCFVVVVIVVVDDDVTCCCHCWCWCCWCHLLPLFVVVADFVAAVVGVDAGVVIGVATAVVGAVANSGICCRYRYCGRCFCSVRSCPGLAQVELDTAVKSLSVVAAAPELYPALVDAGAVTSLLGLLTHENTVRA